MCRQIRLLLFKTDILVPSLNIEALKAFHNNNKNNLKKKEIYTTYKLASVKIVTFRE